MIMEELRPKTVDEMIGNKQMIERVVLSLQLLRPVLIYGQPGIGKTTAVYAIARQYGYRVLEINASDERRKEELMKIYRIARSRLLKSTIILFDEVDGLSRTSWRLLNKILDTAVNPVVLIANEEYRVPEYIKRKCEIVHFYRPSKREILEYVKKLAKERGLEIKDYSKITKDVRNSILALIYGADTYQQTTEFDLVKQIFTGNGANIDFDDKLLIWLLDNAFYFYPDVRDLYDVIQLIAYADLCKRSELFNLFPKGNLVAETEYPYFLRRVSAWKKQRRR